MARDPFHRAWVSEDVALIYESLRSALVEHDPGIAENEIFEETEHYAKQNVVKPHIGAAHANVAIAATPLLIQEYYSSFQPYSLSILRAPPCNFITADSPLSSTTGTRSPEPST